MNAVVEIRWDVQEVGMFMKGFVELLSLEELANEREIH